MTTSNRCCWIYTSQVHPPNRTSSATSCHRGILLKPYRQLFSCKTLSGAKAVLVEENSVGQGAVSDIFRQDLCGSSTCYGKCPPGCTSSAQVMQDLCGSSTCYGECLEGSTSRKRWRQVVSKSPLLLHPFQIHCHAGKARSGSSLAASVQNIERINT